MKKVVLLFISLVFLSGCNSVLNTKGVTESEGSEGVIVCSGSFAGTWQLAGGNLLATTSDFFENGYGKEGETADIGGNHEPNLEKILALHPKTVILSEDVAGHLKLKEPLTLAGIEAKYYSVENFADYLGMLKDFTDITGRDDLYKLNGLEVSSRIAEVIDKLPGEEPPKILLVRAGAGKVSARGSDTMAGAMLSDLGCINIADTKNSLLDNLSMEIIIKENPDFIFATIMGDEEKGKQLLMELLGENTAWSELSAARNNRYIILPKELFHLKPNNRWAESYEFLYEKLYEQ